MMSVEKEGVLFRVERPQRRVHMGVARLVLSARPKHGIQLLNSLLCLLRGKVKVMVMGRGRGSMPRRRGSRRYPGPG